MKRRWIVFLVSKIYGSVKIDIIVDDVMIMMTSDLPTI
jgi:hypothetical protein